MQLSKKKQTKRLRMMTSSLVLDGNTFNFYTFHQIDIKNTTCPNIFI